MAERSAGWYDDEADATWLRYWDGRGWTPHTAQKSVAPSPAPATSAAAATPAPAPAPAHPLVTAQAPAPARPPAPAYAPSPVFAFAAHDGSDELDQPLMQTMRLVPEHTTVPTPLGGAVASASPFATRPVHSGDRLPRGRVVIIVAVALVAGSIVVALASSVAMLLIL
ncbi:DUF2510 domain-containing protein [Agromyces sp. NPDC058104]|uniref:DUF2510 domain-containing protein n=1 Tax=Agromyces sp. NPDC058104 TaxID=3346342 RepID=UPI0036DE9EC0